MLHSVARTRRPRRVDGILFSLILLALRLPTTTAQTIFVSVEGRAVQGKPIFWKPDFVAIMERDGNLVTFSPQHAKDFRQVSPTFSSFSQSALRGELLAEFGHGFDVTGTGHYLVVHPAGQRDQWADRFEQLLRSLQHYFKVRGFDAANPEFPLIAVVFPSQPSYLTYTRRQGINLGMNTLGHYDPKTNRILMFDLATTNPGAEAWYQNAETVIHEATHQSAFNVGIHNRFAESPRWLVEGLGTMFEAPGVWNSREFPDLAQRINRGRLANYRQRVTPRNSLDLLHAQVASDKVFQTNPDLAYAHAWALTFFLAETSPRQYSSYLKLTASRKNFVDYSDEDRLRDFLGAFGGDLKMINARMQRYLDELK